MFILKLTKVLIKLKEEKFDEKKGYKIENSSEKKQIAIFSRTQFNNLSFKLKVK